MAGLIEMATLMWKAEMDETKLNSGVKSAEGQINSLKERTSGFSNFLNKTVLGGILGVTGGLAGMAAVGAKGAIELQDNMAKFQSATGLSAKETENLKGTIKDLYKNNLNSYEELTKMATGLHNNMGMSTEDIKKYSQSFLSFAKVTGQNSEEVVGAIDDIGDAWSLNNEDIKPIMDKLIVSNQKYGLSVTDAQNALKGLAPSFQGLGMSVNDAMGYLNLFASTGVDASSATSAFTIALKKVKSPEELKKLVADIQATEDPTERAKKAIELFGKQGATMANALKPGTESLIDIQKALDGAAGATDKAGKAYDGSLKVQLELAKKQVEGLLVGVGDKLTPTIKNFTEYLQTNMPQIQEKVGKAFDIAGKGIEGFGKAIKFATDHSNILIPVLAGFAGAMGALKVIGLVTTLIDAWKKSTIIATISQKGLNAAIKANPVGMWVTIIGLAITAGIALYQNWDTVKEKAISLWNGIKKPFEAIGNFIGNTWNSIKESTSNTWNNIKEKTSNAWNTMKENTVKTWETMKNKVAENGGGIEGIIKTGIQVYVGVWKKGFDEMDKLTGGKLSSILNSVKTKVEEIKNNISEKWENIKSKTSQTWENIKQKTSETWSAIKNKINEHGGGIKGFIETYMEGYKTVWDKGFTFMDNLTGGKLSNIFNTVKDKMQQIHDTIFGWKEKLAEAWDKIWNLKLPHIPMPHFNITGSFSLNPPSIPHFNVDWYAKGGIFNSPQVIGVGDVPGGEAVLPISKLEGIMENTMQKLGYSRNNNTNSPTTNTTNENYYITIEKVESDNVDSLISTLKTLPRLARQH